MTKVEKSVFGEINGEKVFSFLIKSDDLEVRVEKSRIFPEIIEPSRFSRNSQKSFLVIFK